MGYSWILCKWVICYFSLLQGSYISGVPMPSKRHPEALCCENAEKNSKCTDRFLSTCYHALFSCLCSASYSQRVSGQDFLPAAKILKTSLLLSSISLHRSDAWWVIIAVSQCCCQNSTSHTLPFETFHHFCFLAPVYGILRLS